MLDLAERANIKIGCISMHTVTSFTNVSDCDYEGIGKYKQLRRLMDLSVSIYSPRSKFRYQGLLSILDFGALNIWGGGGKQESEQKERKCKSSSESSSNRKAIKLICSRCLYVSDLF